MPHMEQNFVAMMLDSNESEYISKGARVGEHSNQQRKFFTDVEGPVEKLELYRNKIWMLLEHHFVGFDIKGGNDGEDQVMEGPLVCSGAVEEWIGTEVTCLTEEDTFEEHHIQIYGDTYGRNLQWAVKRILRILPGL